LINPFEEMRLPTADELGLEDISGSFACQDDYCNEVAFKAVYASKDKVLTWKCLKGHVSKIEDFNIG
jgi:hypothetical protein